MLELDEVTAFYGRTQALFGVNLVVKPGETVALVGTNGAGKSTTLRAITGQVRTGGHIRVGEAGLDALPTHERIRRHRIAVVHEGRGLLTALSVHENLVMGADRRARGRVSEIVDLFPVLGDRLAQQVSLLSGGQQQMVALGRALLREPDYLLMDEPALGLAPVVIDEIYRTVADLCSSGMGVVLVEQSVARAASVADRLCLVRLGRVSREVQTSDTAAVNALISEAFDMHETDHE
jgi:branched-chain amino acid transport system ATP-binding protein